MKLKHRLMMGPWITAAMLVLAMAVCAAMLQHTSTTSARQQQSAREVEGALEAIRVAVLQQLSALYRTMAIIDSVGEAKVKQQRQQLAEETKQQIARAVEIAAAIDDPAVRDAQRSLEQAATRFVKAGDMALDMGTVDANTGIAALQTADAEQRQMTAAIGTLYDTTRQRNQQAEAALRGRAQAVTLALGLLALLTAATAVVVAWFAQRRVLGDLQLVSTTASRVAAGSLEHTAQDNRDDELGEVLRAQSTMVERLRGMVSQVSESADSIRVASTEVAGGNADLSQRTEQAAANLQRTASSMEQLTGTVRQSADSAAQANQLASSASGAAQRGGAVMQQVVSNMNDIAGSSKRIADIIGTIDGIAFQTNILALNAAVEAARAGEQGRGFAVVAGEVRNLAQRSAEAAKEIKALIGDSVHKVESGAKLVREAGSAMDEIVTGVQRVSDIIGEISAAAGEQRAGIEQVNGAVSELEQMTQQNAALVEQSAAAAESLREQAHKLSGAVAGFKVGGGSTPAQALPPVAVKATAAPALKPAATAPPSAHAQQAQAAIQTARQRARPDAAAGPAPAGDNDWESF